MNQTCLRCGEHVKSGPACLVLAGDIGGDGIFTGREACGDPDADGRVTALPIRLKMG
jgi:hypothetical protein